MALYFTDVFSGSADWIVTDPHAQGTIVKASQGTGYVNPKYEYQYSLAKTNGRLLGLFITMRVAMTRSPRQHIFSIIFEGRLVKRF